MGAPMKYHLDPANGLATTRTDRRAILDPLLA